MGAQVKTNNADFAGLEKLTARYDIPGRTKSASLLLWFLETVYRLEEIEAADAVCDKKHDAGIDAIVVNDVRQEVFLFQAKRREKLPATLGDTVGDDRKLPETIAYRTNNQNPITMRDMSSNDIAQIQLKSEFDKLYGDKAVYGIKRGDNAGVHELGNEYAGRLLLSLYVREPWSAHQKYRIFDDLETKIFDYATTASKIRLAQIIGEEVQPGLEKIKIRRLAKYGLTRFIIVYLVGETLRLSPAGMILLEKPEATLASKDKNKIKERKMRKYIREIIDFIVLELNYFIDQQGEENYDYKSEFKSNRAIAIIRDEILNHSRRTSSEERRANMPSNVGPDLCEGLVLAARSFNGGRISLWLGKGSLEGWARFATGSAQRAMDN